MNAAYPALYVTWSKIAKLARARGTLASSIIQEVESIFFLFFQFPLLLVFSISRTINLEISSFFRSIILNLISISFFENEFKMLLEQLIFFSTLYLKKEIQKKNVSPDLSRFYRAHYFVLQKYLKRFKLKVDLTKL